MSTPHPHAARPPSRTRSLDIPQECRTASVSTPRATRPATRAPRRRPTRTPPARVTDPRDATDIDFDAVNNKQHYALYSVFALGESLPADDGERGRIVARSLDYVKGAGAEIAKPVSGFRRSGPDGLVA